MSKRGKWRPVPGCSGKLKFASRHDAETSALHHDDPKWTAAGEKRKPLFPYECPACRCWHLSHIPSDGAGIAIARKQERDRRNAELVQKLLKERGLR